MATNPKKKALPKKLPVSKSIAKKPTALKQSPKKVATKQTPKTNAATAEHLHYHQDGSLWARGEKLAGDLHGYWEWYRKDGTRMRSGHFDRGVQCGEWITYDRAGGVYKVTVMKGKK